MKLNIHLLLNIHWDREWFLTKESSQSRLYALFIDAFKFIEKTHIPLTLDGQIICLEDLLDIVTAKEKEWILDLIKRSLIHIGPLYVQPDLTIPSGELFLANLMTGIKKRTKYGISEKQEFAYFPDSPGAFGQLPQILKKAGIRHVFLGRGVPHLNGALEFMWKAPSGEEVTVTYLPRGYKMLRLSELYENGRLNINTILNVVERYTPVLKSNCFLLPVLFEPYECFPIRETADSNQMNIQWSSLDLYAADCHNPLSSLPVYEGELRSSVRSFIHPGVLSSRIYLKQLHKQCEKEYFNLLEPLLAMCRISGYKDAFGLVRRALVLLIQNTAQDSIGGCAIDMVGEDVKSRYRHIYELIDGTFYQLIYHYGSQVDTSMMANDEYANLFLNFHYAGGIRPVECEVELPPDFDERSICFVSPQNIIIPGKIIEVHIECQKKFQKSLDIHYKTVKRCKLAFLINMPSFGHTIVRISHNHNKKYETKNNLAFADNQMENEYLKIRLDQDSGKLVIIDKRTGRKIEANQFCRIPDFGDLYSHDLEWEQKSDFNILVHSSIKDERPLRLTLEYLCVLNHHVPEKKIEIAASVILYSELPYCYFRTEIRNQHIDQVIAVRYTMSEDFTGIQTGDIYKKRREEWISILSEENSNIEDTNFHRPMQDYITIESNSKPIFTLSVSGLYEYLLNPKERNAVYLILLRSVGWTSRDNLRNRKGSFGPSYKTPGGQCHGIYTYQYAIGFNWKTQTSTNIPQLPDISEYKPKAVVLKQQKAPLPAVLSYIRINPTTVQLQRFYVLENGKRLYLLLFNTENTSIKTIINFYFPVKNVRLLNLLGNPLYNSEDRIKMTGNNEFELFFESHGIVLVELNIKE